MPATDRTLPPSSAAAGARFPPVVLACLAVTWVVWGSTYLAIKWALVGLAPFVQMGTRFVAAGLVLLAWARWRGAGWPDRTQWHSAWVLGALMLGGGYGLTAVAETSVGSGLVVAFIAVVPALVALMQWPYGHRPGPRQALGIAVGLAGIGLLTRGQSYAASPAGLAAIAGACLLWSLGTVWAKHGLPGGRALKLAPGAMGYASQMLAGSVLLLLMSAVMGERPAWPPEPLAVWAWAYLVVAGSLIAFSAVMLLLQRTPTAVSSSYAYVNPVIGLMLGVTIGGETLHAGEWLAAALITGSVVLMLSGRR